MTIYIGLLYSKQTRRSPQLELPKIPGIPGIGDLAKTAVCFHFYLVYIFLLKVVELICVLIVYFYLINCQGNLPGFSSLSGLLGSSSRPARSLEPEVLQDLSI